MKTIIAGSRTITDMSTVVKAIAESGFDVTAIISGMAAGVDTLAVRYARQNGVYLIEMPADWSQGRSAGYKRNVQMADIADALIAVWDGKSSGTKHMIDIARQRKLQVYVRILDSKDGKSAPMPPHEFREVTQQDVERLMNNPIIKDIKFKAVDDGTV